MSESKQTIDERFTIIADNVTQWVGKWWFTVISLLLLILWIIYGIIFIPNWFTSTTWNFPANSITTLGEWFMEGLILAAANRVERRHVLLLKEIKGHIHVNEATTKRDLSVNRTSEEEIAQLREDIRAIKEAVLAKGMES